MIIIRFAAPLSVAFLAAAANAQSLMSTKGEIFAAFGDSLAAVPGPTIGGSSPVDTAVMDLNGNLLARVRLTGGGVTTLDDRVLLYGRTAADMIVVARGGAAEPTGTMPGVTLNSATSSGPGGSYRLSPQNGFVLFGSSLSGTGVTAGVNDSALFWGVPGALLVLARRGDATPGGGGSTLNTSFSTISHQPTCMNSQGVTCFQATLAGGDVVGTTNNFAWLYGTPGNLELLIRKGDTIAVPGGTGVIGTVGFGGQMNEAGQVLHDEKLSTTLGTAPATTATDGLLMLYTPGSGNQILAREGDAAPGTLGAVYNALNMSVVGLTRSGRICFHASLSGGDVVAGVNDHAAYSGDAVNGFAMALRRGDAAPGGAAGETVTSINTSSLCINDSGAMAFFGSVTGPSVTTANDGTLWAGMPGNFALVAREGDPAPGVAGATFSQVVAGSVNLNDRGCVIFNCQVTDGTTTSSAVYGHSPTYGLVLLLLGGETITTSAGPQTVANDGGIQFNSGDGSALTFNNNGDFVRRVNFSTGAAIIRCHLGDLLATPASVPATGGTQAFELNAGPAHAGGLYVLAGTLAGTRPGFVFGGASIPLNPDPWLSLSIQGANSAIYPGSWGLLDGQGRATASFVFPAGYPWMQGALFHHAFVVLDLSTVTPVFVSEPASLRLY
jgi:hypothetical protein